MIFVTVGAQMPFDRLVRAVDAWAALKGQCQVLAQIGTGGWRPQHIQWTELLCPDEFRQQIRMSRVVVGHAGMGTILTSLQYARPLIVMPRRADLRETRNDHQRATAKRFSSTRGLYVGMGESQLTSWLEESESFPKTTPLCPFANPRLIAAVRRFIAAGQTAPGLQSVDSPPTKAASVSTKMA